MDIISKVKEEVINLSNEYKNNSSDNYDFWNEHIKYVYKESIILAQKYNADIEIVKLASLLHDIALIKNVGTKDDHHINGKKLASDILDKYNYPEDKKEKVLGCILNHRSSSNASNIEELCVADADILAHFDNIPLNFELAFNKFNKNLSDVREFLSEWFLKDFNDLSEKTKEAFKERYDLICKIVIGK